MSILAAAKFKAVRARVANLDISYKEIEKSLEEIRGIFFEISLIVYHLIKIGCI